jgi:hypothetical protein
MGCIKGKVMKMIRGIEGGLGASPIWLISKNKERVRVSAMMDNKRAL